MAGARGIRYHLFSAGAQRGRRDRHGRKQVVSYGGTPTSGRLRRDGRHPGPTVFSPALLSRRGGGAEGLWGWDRRKISLAFRSAQGRYFPQSVSQAARKKLTRSRTKSGNSLRSCFAPSPINARIIIGSRMTSMKICAVE